MFRHNHILKTLLALVLIMAIQSVMAQAVVFSSDQWPKRWGRVMHSQPMSGFINNTTQSGFKKVSYRQEKSRRPTWGKQTTKQRATYSQTPEYNYKHYPIAQQPVYSRYNYPMNYAPAYPSNFLGAYPMLGGYGAPMSPMGVPSLLIEPTHYPSMYAPVMGNPNLGYPMGYLPYGAQGVSNANQYYPVQNYRAPAYSRGMYPW